MYHWVLIFVRFYLECFNKAWLFQSAPITNHTLKRHKKIPLWFSIWVFHRAHNSKLPFGMDTRKNENDINVTYLKVLIMEILNHQVLYNKTMLFWLRNVSLAVLSFSLAQTWFQIQISMLIFRILRQNPPILFQKGQYHWTQ